MDVYAENILEHFKNPQHQGEGTGSSVSHEEKNVSCGDAITAHLTIEDGVLKQIEWQGTGCAISLAGMSMLSEELVSKQTADILAMNKDSIYELLGVPIGPRRFKCALIGLHAVKNAIHLHEGNDPQSWLQTVEID